MKSSENFEELLKALGEWSPAVPRAGDASPHLPSESESSRSPRSAGARSRRVPGGPLCSPFQQMCRCCCPAEGSQGDQSSHTVPSASVSPPWRFSKLKGLCRHPAPLQPQKCPGLTCPTDPGCSRCPQNCPQNRLRQDPHPLRPRPPASGVGRARSHGRSWNWGGTGWGVPGALGRIKSSSRTAPLLLTLSSPAGELPEQNIFQVRGYVTNISG